MRRAVGFNFKNIDIGVSIFGNTGGILMPKTKQNKKQGRIFLLIE